MSSKCNEFNELLLELAYDELDETTTRRLEQHKEECSACLQAYAEIASVRSVAQSIEEPQVPNYFDANILSMAKQAAEEFKTKQAEHSIHPPVQSPSRPTLLEKVQTFIFKPPVYGLGLAAAAALIAIVSLQSNHHATMLEPTDGSPFVGATKVVEQEELPPAVKHEKEIHNDGLEPQIQKAGPNYQATMAEAAANADNNASKVSSQAHKLDTTTSPQKKAAPIQINKNPADLLGNNKVDTTGPRELKSRSINSAPAAPNQYKTAVETAPIQAASKKSSSKKSRSTESAGFPRGTPESAMEEAENEAIADVDAVATNTFFADGLEAYNRGDCKRAIYSFKKMLDSDTGPANSTPTATHYIAKCEKRTGRCGQALISYERLLKQYYGYGKRDEVLYEAATCHKKLGHTDRAKELLNELSLHPKWKSKADSELESLQK